MTLRGLGVDLQISEPMNELTTLSCKSGQIHYWLRGEGDGLPGI
jgi:hypothetical protein